MGWSSGGMEEALRARTGFPSFASSWEHFGNRWRSGGKGRCHQAAGRCVSPNGFLSCNAACQQHLPSLLLPDLSQCSSQIWRMPHRTGLSGCVCPAGRGSHPATRRTWQGKLLGGWEPNKRHALHRDCGRIWHGLPSPVTCCRAR